MQVYPEKARKILVVDDELDTRIFLQNLLSADGFLPITAESKTEGIRVAEAERPSVIILNMTMRDKGGIQLYRDLKLKDDLKHIPVIMLSSLDRETFVKCHILYGQARCEAFEFYDKFMAKPPEADELLEAVRKLSHQDDDSK